MIFSQAAIQTRKKRAQEALSAVLKENEIVLVACGEPIHKPGGHDQTYPFLPHPDYLWLTGSKRPFGVSVYTTKEGWVDFVMPITREERIWEGAGEVIKGRPVQELESYIAHFRPTQVFSLGESHCLKRFSKATETERMDVQEVFNVVRRIKDAEEVELVTRLGSLAAKGYAKVKSIIRPGLTERDIQLEYEAEVLRAGAEKMPYESIVGTGTNSAVLHAIPTMRALKAGEHVLIDAGADMHDYCVDITRNFAVNGSMNERQKAIHDIVLRAQGASISLCRPGVEWREVHFASARVIAEGLKALGLLHVAADEALETEAIGVFLPHGVGHMVGLRVRDVGGPYNPHPKKYAGARLRVDMPLHAGHLMTVEPGLYFIEALLNDGETRSKFKQQINWSEVEKWLDFGGMRIEDDILVTQDGPQNLTAMVEK